VKQHQWRNVFRLILLVSAVCTLSFATVAAEEASPHNQMGASLPFLDPAVEPGLQATYRVYLPTLATAWPNPAGNAVGPVIAAESVPVSPPFERQAGYIMQAMETTNPAEGGRAIYSFTVEQRGTYVIAMLVDAPDTGANSLFVGLNTNTITPEMYWDITPTNGFEARTVAYQTNNGAPLSFTLEAGTHTITLVGRERNVKVASLWLEAFRSDAPNPTPSEVSNRFGPPTLTNPQTIVISNANPSFFGRGTEDVIVRIREKMTVPVNIGNVRNLVLIGGEFTITKPLVASLPNGSKEAIAEHRALALSNIRQTLYVEGVHINNSGMGLSEGLQVWSVSGDVIIRNSRIEGIRTKPNDPDFKFNHPDLIQVMGASNRFILENVTLADSDYQGLLVSQEPGQRIGAAYFYNVNTRDVARQAWFFGNLGAGAVRVCENCWHDTRGSNRPNNAFYGFFPNPNQRGSTVVWNGIRQVVDGLSIQLGTPPGGDVVPASAVGMNYNPSTFQR
jgi:hypothetical protein